MKTEENQNVLVTGADGGLGIPVVTRLLSRGWHVTAFLRHEENGEKLKAHFNEEENKRLSLIFGDITLAEDIERGVSKIKDLAALVHLAGGFEGAATFAEHDVLVYNQMFDLNTRSTFLLLRAVLPVLKKQNHGSIVTMGAKPAIEPGINNAVYSASKAALINFTLTAAEEGRKNNVRANVIVPAVIRTAANLKWATSKEEAKKWTAPEDIADVICWLIADESKMVTGTVIPMFNQIRP